MALGLLKVGTGKGGLLVAMAALETTRDVGDILLLFLPMIDVAIHVRNRVVRIATGRVEVSLVPLEMSHETECL